VTEPSVGGISVQIARETIEGGLRSDGPYDPPAAFRYRFLPTPFDEPRGVFVTLTNHEKGVLRGCIGFSKPLYPLRVALPKAAWSAAVEDPRFPSLTQEELAWVLIEVSILTVPELLPTSTEPDRRFEAVQVGKDGLIVEADGHAGLLLPQVARDEQWDAVEFLSYACLKAGLPMSAWRRAVTRVFRFQAEIFRESTPGGVVVQRGE
jgi:uncharacterized protein (TIGR00296 family)